MPTSSERTALLFLALVAIVGAGVRVTSARRLELDVRAGEGSAQERSPTEALIARQLAAVDSAQGARKGKASKKRAVTPRTRRSDSSVSRKEPTLSRGGRRSPPESPFPIDVNSASAKELEQLPYVGPALAQRIVARRDRHGPFASMDDLRHVRGIGVTTAARLAPMVTFSSGYRPSRGAVRP